MNKELIECMKLLKIYRYRINKQEYKTFKGQILANEFDAFRKGLFKLALKKI